MCSFLLKQRCMVTATRLGFAFKRISEIFKGWTSFPFSLCKLHRRVCFCVCLSRWCVAVGSVPRVRVRSRGGWRSLTSFLQQGHRKTRARANCNAPPPCGGATARCAHTAVGFPGRRQQTQGKGGGCGKREGSQTHGDGKGTASGWRAHNAAHGCRVTELHTENLYDLGSRCHPDKFNDYVINKSIKMTHKQQRGWCQPPSTPWTPGTSDIWQLRPELNQEGRGGEWSEGNGRDREGRLGGGREEDKGAGRDDRRTRRGFGSPRHWERGGGRSGSGADAVWLRGRPHCLLVSQSAENPIPRSDLHTGFYAPKHPKSLAVPLLGIIQCPVQPGRWGRLGPGEGSHGRSDRSLSFSRAMHLQGLPRIPLKWASSCPLYKDATQQRWPYLGMWYTLSHLISPSKDMENNPTLTITPAWHLLYSCNTISQRSVSSLWCSHSKLDCEIEVILKNQWKFFCGFSLSSQCFHSEI